LLFQKLLNIFSGGFWTLYGYEKNLEHLIIIIIIIITITTTTQGIHTFR
jgi:uncharacterized membrane protein YccF (DUF307 family)